MRTRRFTAAFAVLGWITAFTAATAGASGTAQAAGSVPRPDHTVVVMMENHSYADIIGDTTDAPYINALASQGASFTNSFAVAHPSEPNYLALYSGSTQGLTNDSCPHSYSGANLGSELLGAGLGFAGYSESMPSDGYTGCTSGEYARKHNPWSDFTNVPSTANRTFADFPSDYSTLPAVSFVIPNLLDDMHDGTIAEGDTWLKNNLDGYVQWAKTHNSLLVLTWDEDDYSQSNQVPTLFVGAGVTPGTYGEQIDHYTVLRTLEDAYGLAPVGNSASATPITDIWSASPSGGGCTAGQLLGNPGFETGTAPPWTAGSGVISNDSANEPAHSGTWDAWLDGYGSAHTDTLSQSVAVPAGCTSVKFSFWLHVDTAETGGTANDTLTVQATAGSATTTLASYSNLDAASGYTQHGFDLTAFAGQTVTLTFTGTENGSLQTSFVVDDTALDAS